jgi:histidinol-phosphate aminotransferase
MSVLAIARPELLSLKPYSSARMEAGRAMVMLNANESPLVPYADDELALNRYPDPQPAALLAALAGLYGTVPERLFVGRGSDEAIDLLTRAFCRAGEDAILISPPTFGMYAVAAGVQGARTISVPLTAAGDFRLDVEALLAAVVPSVKLVFICTPNNPTGSLVPLVDIERVARELRGRALLVVDEAYLEYAGTPSAIGLIDEFAHVAVLRTMSKAYALAGARLGVLVAHPEVIGLLRRIMAPYPLPTPCVAAAMRALAVRAQHEARIADTRLERERLYAALSAHPRVRRVWHSAANFLSFIVDDAKATWRGLAERGVLVRDVSHYLKLDGGLRVSIGTRADNNAFLEAL